MKKVAVNKEVWLDGKSVANFNVDDLARSPLMQLQRAFAYGDGLFETIAVVDSCPRLLSLHLERLTAGCQRLAITLDVEALRSEIINFLSAAKDGVLRIVVVRADFERGYRIRPGATSHRLLQFFAQPINTNFSDSPDAVLQLCRQRLSRQPALAGMKHLNRLEQVLAHSEWSDPVIADGLMLDTQGLVIEAVVSNVFMVKDGALLTPRLDQCGVAGVMRRVLVEFLQIDIQETALTLDDLYGADEVFLTNSTRGIQPVVQLGCVHWPRGSVTIALQNKLQKFLANTSL